MMVLCGVSIKKKKVLKILLLMKLLDGDSISKQKLIEMRD